MNTKQSIVSVLALGALLAGTAAWAQVGSGSATGAAGVGASGGSVTTQGSGTFGQTSPSFGTTGGSFGAGANTTSPSTTGSGSVQGSVNTPFGSGAVNGNAGTSAPFANNDRRSQVGAESNVAPSNSTQNLPPDTTNGATVSPFGTGR